MIEESNSFCDHLENHESQSTARSPLIHRKVFNTPQLEVSILKTGYQKCANS